MVPPLQVKCSICILCIQTLPEDALPHTRGSVSIQDLLGYTLFVGLFGLTGGYFAKGCARAQTGTGGPAWEGRQQQQLGVEAVRRRRVL